MKCDGIAFTETHILDLEGLAMAVMVYALDEGGPKNSKIPLSHFRPNVTMTCFDKLVLICTYFLKLCSLSD